MTSQLRKDFSKIVIFLVGLLFPPVPSGLISRIMGFRKNPPGSYPQTSSDLQILKKNVTNSWSFCVFVIFSKGIRENRQILKKLQKNNFFWSFSTFFSGFEKLYMFSFRNSNCFWKWWFLSILEPFKVLKSFSGVPQNHQKSQKMMKKTSSEVLQ